MIHFFSCELNKNSVFLKENNDLSIIVLKESDSSYVIHISSFLNGKTAEEAHDAIFLAEKQINILNDSKIEILFFTISKIDLSEASEMLKKAKNDFQNRNYIQSTSLANQATFNAIASEL